VDIETIPIDIQGDMTLKLSDIAESVELIPLETTREGLLTGIRKIIIRNDKYYIKSGVVNSRLLAFDEGGRFLFKIDRRGQGPGDYIDMRDFTLTDNSDIKMVTYGKVLTYDSLGRFLHEKQASVTEYVGEDIIPFTESSYLVHQRTLYDKYNLLCILDGRDEFGNDFFPVSPSAAVISGMTIDNNALSSYDDDIYFKYPYCDTIYRISKEKDISYAYYVDYGSQKIDSSLFEDITDASQASMEMQKIRDRMLPVYARSGGMGINSAFVWVGTYAKKGDKQHGGYFSLYSKQTKQVLTGNLIMDDIYMKGVTIKLRVVDFPMYMDEDYLIWPLRSSFLLRGYEAYKKRLTTQQWEAFSKQYSRLVEICSAMKEDDNPLLVRIKLKKW
jgi:hypothetical protein